MISLTLKNYTRPKLVWEMCVLRIKKIKSCKFSNLVNLGIIFSAYNCPHQLGLGIDNVT
jgi:hypothetical protein